MIKHLCPYRLIITIDWDQTETAYIIELQLNTKGIILATSLDTTIVDKQNKRTTEKNGIQIDKIKVSTLEATQEESKARNRNHRDR